MVIITISMNKSFRYDTGLSPEGAAHRKRDKKKTDE